MEYPIAGILNSHTAALLPLIINKLAILVWLHFIGDFVLQSRYIADNKGRSVVVLLQHSFLYSIPFIFIDSKFAIVNGCLHFFVDLGSSKLTRRYYEREEYYQFFTVIGFDRSIHMSCLFFTYWLLVSGYL